MTLRRCTPLRPSRPKTIPAALRIEVLQADNGCVGRKLGMPGDCVGALQLDHVRASGAIGRKSPSVKSNLVSLCARCHQTKTLNGREWRPRLLEYIDRRDAA